MRTTTALRPRRLAIFAVASLGTLGLAAGLHSAPATAASVTVSTGTGAGPTDPNWNVTVPAGSPTAATLITTAPTGWTATVTGAQWIAASAAPTADPVGSYVFSTTLVVPAGASSLSGSLASLDAASISLVKGVTTTAVPGSFGGSATTPTPVTFAGPLAAGSYTLKVTLDHAVGTTAAGLIATFTATDGQPPATQYYGLPTPIRVYDSRTGTGPAATGDGVIASGSTRTVSLLQGYASPTATVKVGAVPAGATSAMVNVTIDGTTATGFLTAYAGNATQPATSGINWFGTGQILANLSVVALAPDGTIKVTAGGGGTTQVIVDVVGYYR